MERELLSNVLFAKSFVSSMLLIAMLELSFLSSLFRFTLTYGELLEFFALLPLQILEDFSRLKLGVPSFSNCDGLSLDFGVLAIRSYDFNSKKTCGWLNYKSKLTIYFAFCQSGKIFTLGFYLL